MKGNIRYQVLQNIAGNLFEIKKTERLWHIPLLASLCTGIPLLAGFILDALPYGILASTAGLVILYLPGTSVSGRMVTMLACSFGIMLSFTVGILFSFNPWISAIVLGLLSCSVQWIAHHFRMKPPGAFFFIMVATIASCMPFDLSTIVAKVGAVGMGGMLACSLAFIYSLYIVRRYPTSGPRLSLPAKKEDDNVFESVLTGLFISVSLLAGHLLQLQNPYWIPISCLAVLQGATLEHIWQRSFQRILGTITGLGITWLILQLPMTPLTVCAFIFILQFVVEMLIVRHYGLAVMAITPLTILLAETGRAMQTDPNILLPSPISSIR